MLPQEVKGDLENFVQGLTDIYGNGLVSLNLYGSAASGDFSTKHSNVNLAVVLDDASLDNLARSYALINDKRYRSFNPIFFTEDYLKRSSDVFPIEFLDMKENHLVLYGKDVLKDLKVDTAHLRFQCEQELKSKLINIKRLYLKTLDKRALKDLLFRSFTSCLHLLRNMIRLKGKTPSYSKEEVLREIANEFQIDIASFSRISEAKSKGLPLRNKEINELFHAFVADLERIVDLVDRL